MLTQNGGMPVRVYCAGPLFNESERREMTEIADLLEEAGYAIYLPHRDGMEFRLILEILEERGWAKATAAAFLHAAIFALDIYQLVIECDAVVWNLNGRVPDEGAVSEAAVAWTLGKPIVAYSDDVRSLISGRVNPLLVGMVDFDTLDEMHQIPKALRDTINGSPLPQVHENSLPDKIRKSVRDGRLLWEVLQDRSGQLNDAVIAEVVEELFAPDVAQNQNGTDRNASPSETAGWQS
ncbi:nucleoside 2-deoxyribosyltransferase [Calycomorphotria hydatis]|uniref:Nucleoside 2-deoxyribosyltransferase n=1 Tax=Calycomorphotria hydatis TaxID=2528027 RepID=A0A517T5N1_9PLAN|nr:nucleoside 2-deoxyribosyltransferase [Calycomorphotria hydatis]QDT63661.1 Nucleoside 2-deoxyribosyltransferase [Calycomorphotria hydatis]